MLKLFKSQQKESTEGAIEKTRLQWFNPIKQLFKRPEIDDDLWEKLEELLISADVGFSATQRLLNSLKNRIHEEGIKCPENTLDILKKEMVDSLTIDLESNALKLTKTPLVILMVGVNGVGKTTNIAKLAQLYKKNDYAVLLGAADTFRAAAIGQLQVWGDRIGVDVIAHQQGADPGAVAFDTLAAATARKSDIVLIDTAGRMHNKVNLMEELKKIQRVLARKQENLDQRVLLTIDASTGQNGLAQARSFDRALKCHGIFLSKLDGTAKGGIVLAISEELKLPILFVGTGEQLEHISSFEPSQFVEALFGSVTQK